MIRAPIVAVRSYHSCVYFLGCADGDGPLYVKIGLANNVHKRIQGILTGCPIDPQDVRWVELRSRERASSLEKSMQQYMDAWHARREWFVIPRVDVDAFWERVRVCLDMELCRGGWSFKSIDWLSYAIELQDNLKYARKRHCERKAAWSKGQRARER